MIIDILFFSYCTTKIPISCHSSCGVKKSFTKSLLLLVLKMYISMIIAWIYIVELQCLPFLLKSLKIYFSLQSLGDFSIDYSIVSYHEDQCKIITLIIVNSNSIRSVRCRYMLLDTQLRLSWILQLKRLKTNLLVFMNQILLSHLNFLFQSYQP